MLDTKNKEMTDALERMARVLAMNDANKTEAIQGIAGALNGLCGERVYQAALNELEIERVGESTEEIQRFAETYTRLRESFMSSEWKVE